jgi:hypothetical protein
MCKVKNHLFELSAMFGFINADADRPAVPGRIIFSSRLDWSLPEAALTSHGARRTCSNTSEFSVAGLTCGAGCGWSFEIQPSR